MKSMSAEQVTSFLAVAQKHSTQDYLMFLVTFCHALRISETLSLTKENIVGGHLVMQRLKGSCRTIQPLMPQERDAILQLAATCEGRFFNICRKTAWSHFQQYGKEAGIPDFLLHPHTLRHSAAMIGLKGGMKINELQNYLGHKSGGNTLVYLQCEDDVASKAFAKAVGYRG